MKQKLTLSNNPMMVLSVFSLLFDFGRLLFEIADSEDQDVSDVESSMYFYQNYDCFSHQESKLFFSLKFAWFSKNDIFS